MESYQFDGFNIILNKKGATEYSKISCPVRYGYLSEIRTQDYLYQYNLNGEIKYIQGVNGDWPHPSEWLKRTVANDWVYYSAGSYDDVYDVFGEYYIPCLSYPSNAFMGVTMFTNRVLEKAVSSWEKIPEKLAPLCSGSGSKPLHDFLTRVIRNKPMTLEKRAHQLHTILDGRITVLPPDARHVDYEVIPLIVADGCLYNCGFCRIKTDRHFKQRTESNIIDQIQKLKVFYDKDLRNYNSIFLGQHDALYAGAERIEFAARKAYELFDLGHSYLNGPKLFLFGSVDSILKSEKSLFEMLNRLPFDTYINLGLESADPHTLAVLRKPVLADAVREAFSKMLKINKRYERIEVSANFVIGKNLPQTHLSCLVDLARNGLNHFYSKGAVYLSPLADGETRREILGKFYEIKRTSRLPVYAYLIQRL